MKQDRALLLLPLITALAHGKIIQHRNVDGDWVDNLDPGFFGDTEYRIKPDIRINFVTVYSHKRVGGVLKPCAPRIGGYYETPQDAERGMAKKDAGVVMELVVVDGGVPFLRPLTVAVEK
jgi:hypothetical protein